jgi:hypothetical protein
MKLPQLAEFADTQRPEARVPIERLLADAELRRISPTDVPASPWRTARAIGSSVNVLVFIGRSSPPGHRVFGPHPHSTRADVNSDSGSGASRPQLISFSLS